LPELSNEEILRYSRHLIMPEVGMQGQRRLKGSSVLMIGTGGLGAPVGMYLAAAGSAASASLISTWLKNRTCSDRSSRHERSRRRKIESARDRLRDINPHIEIETHETRLTSHNAMRLFRNYDIIVDGTDNFPTRYLVNDACVLRGSQTSTARSSDLKDRRVSSGPRRARVIAVLYPEPPPPGLVPSCAEGGVLGVLPGIVGAIQANETIKIILGAEDLLINRLLLFDAWPDEVPRVQAAEGSEVSCLRRAGRRSRS
jgi:adenylyltransferase/sulfurtransferase